MRSILLIGIALLSAQSFAMYGRTPPLASAPHIEAQIKLTRMQRSEAVKALEEHFKDAEKVYFLKENQEKLKLGMVDTYVTSLSHMVARFDKETNSKAAKDSALHYLDKVKNWTFFDGLITDEGRMAFETRKAGFSSFEKMYPNAVNDSAQKSIQFGHFHEDIKNVHGIDTSLPSKEFLEKAKEIYINAHGDSTSESARSKANASLSKFIITKGPIELPELKPEIRKESEDIERLSTQTDSPKK